MTDAEKYATKVINKKTAPKFVQLAAKRFLKQIHTKGFYYDENEAKKVVNFFENHLKQWEGNWQGESFKLELWQKFLLHNIYGLYKDGRRLITRVYVQVPRKNGKTALLAGISNYHLFADRVKTPQILIGANNEDQAKLCSTSAGNQIESSPNLRYFVDSGDCNVYKYRGKVKSIVHKSRNGFLEAMSRETKTKDGFNPSLGAIDEYHEAEDSALLDVIRSGQGARPEPLLIVITTAGFRKTGPCYSELRKVSIDILEDRKKDDSHFSMIFEPDQDDDWESPKTWKKVNPNYNVSVFPHYLKSRYLEAKNEGANKEVDFKTKNLNVWTDSASVWIQDEIWMRCADRIDLAKAVEKTWYGGLDMALKRDWTAFVLISEPDKDGIIDVLSWFYIPEDTVSEKTEKEHSSIRDWVKGGLITLTEGSTTDPRFVADSICKIGETYNIKQVVCDPALAIATMNDLNANGIEAIGIPQTKPRLTPPIAKLYELVLNQKIRHGGNPVMRWMLGNCMIKQYENDLASIIKESPVNKIDGIDALINALAPLDFEQDNTNFIADAW